MLNCKENQVCYENEGIETVGKSLTVKHTVTFKNGYRERPTKKGPGRTNDSIGTSFEKGPKDCKL